VAQDALDHVALVDERNDAHLFPAFRAQERIGFPDLLDEFPPLGRGDTARFVFGDIDDLHGPARGCGLFGGVFVALAAHLVAVPAVIPDELEALVRDVLGDGRYEVARTEDLEVALYLRIEAGTVDNRSVRIGAVGLRDLHLFDGEGVADDVLGQPLDVPALVGQYPPAPMHVEPGMHPAAQHLGAGGWQQTLLDQKCDDSRTEHLLQRLDAHIGQAVEQPRAGEEAVGDQGVEVGMEVQVLAEGVDRHDDAGQPLGQVEGVAQVFEQALVRQAAQVLEQVAVEAEVRAQHLGDSEGEMPVRDREQDRLGQQRAEELDFLLVA